MLIEEFAVKSMSPAEVSFEDFTCWVENHKVELENIYDRGGERSEINAGVFLKVKDLLEAEQYFLAFQAFLGFFIKNDIDTNRFKMIYRGFSDVLQRRLSLKKKYYGDIYLIVDQEHEKKLIERIVGLKNEIKNFSKIQTLGSIEYEKFTFPIPSKSGIGNGNNFRQFQGISPELSQQ